MKKERGESVFGVLFNKERTHVLLIERRDIPVKVLPGGGIEPGESPEVAALREMQEEVGCTLRLLRKIARYLPQNKLSRITHVFEFEIVNGNPSVCEETAAVGFFPLKDLPEMPPPFKSWIEDAAQNLPYVIEKKIEGTSYFTLIKNMLLHPMLVMRFLLTRLGIHFNRKR